MLPNELLKAWLKHGGFGGSRVHRSVYIWLASSRCSSDNGCMESRAVGIATVSSAMLVSGTRGY